jgi:hypothetical protein
MYFFTANTCLFYYSLMIFKRLYPGMLRKVYRTFLLSVVLIWFINNIALSLNGNYQTALSYILHKQLFVSLNRKLLREEFSLIRLSTF